MMKLIALALWIGAACVLYLGLRARLLPHQPRWQAAVIVGVLCVGALGWSVLWYFTSQRPNYGVEDGGEEYRSGRPESL